MFLIALRNLFRHKARTALTLAAIVFGVASMVITGGFVRDVYLQLQEATVHSRLGHLQIYRAGYYEHGRRAPFQYLIEDGAALQASVAASPHVVEVLPRLEFTGLLSNGRGDLPVVAEGVDGPKETRLGSAVTMVAGRALAADDAFGIMLGEGVARVLQLKPGDVATLLSSTPDGAVNTYDFDVVGVFRTLSQDYDARAVRVALPAAQDLLVTGGVHSLVVLLDDTARTDDALRALRETLPADYELFPWYTLADFYQKTVSLYERQFLVLQMIVAILVVLSVTNSVTMVVHERIGEYGTLRALGERDSDVFRLVVTENLLLGIVGGLAGVAAGVLLAAGISAAGITMPPPPNMSSGYVVTIRLATAFLAQAFVLGVIATLVGALRPAWRASRVPISEALQQNV